MMEASDIISDTASATGSSHDRLSAMLEKRLEETEALLSSAGRSPPSEKGPQSPAIIVINKSDLVDIACANTLASVESALGQKRSLCIVSCKTGQGLDNFLEILRGKVEALCGNPMLGNPSLTQARHRSNLRHCLAALQAFDAQPDLVMAAEQLRMALRHLGKITGRVGVEEILDVVFQDFCIGK